jgi:hypothetical protein
MVINKNSIQNLKKFKAKSKFDPDQKLYTGLSKSELKTKLTEILNQSADDFITTVNNKPTEKKFQDDIKKGLSRFNPYYLNLDTEDREKVCSYFEELMDCVGLESSDGVLNKWLYGFDPTKHK